MLCVREIISQLLIEATLSRLKSTVNIISDICTSTKYIGRPATCGEKEKIQLLACVVVRFFTEIIK